MADVDIKNMTEEELKHLQEKVDFRLRILAKEKAIAVPIGVVNRLSKRYKKFYNRGYGSPLFGKVKIQVVLPVFVNNDEGEFFIDWDYDIHLDQVVDMEKVEKQVDSNTAIQNKLKKWQKSYENFLEAVKKTAEKYRVSEDDVWDLITS